MGTLILNSLEIRNFRAFRDLKIEHLGRVNLLVGKNNVGKTSLLEVIQLYASRASTPTFIWEIMRARHEVKQPFVNVKDMLTASSTCFMGITISSRDFSLSRLALSTHHKRCFQSWLIGQSQNHAMVLSIRGRWSQEKVMPLITYLLVLLFNLLERRSAILSILLSCRVYSG